MLFLYIFKSKKRGQKTGLEPATSWATPRGEAQVSLSSGVEKRAAQGTHYQIRKYASVLTLAGGKKICVFIETSYGAITECFIL